jgi:hypothetical protein
MPTSIWKFGLSFSKFFFFRCSLQVSFRLEDDIKKLNEEVTVQVKLLVDEAMTLSEKLKPEISEEQP